MRIVIDARFYGLENAGLGRYTLNLVKSLQELDNQNDYFILLRAKYFKELILKANFTKVLAEVPHYSLAEQLQLPQIIKALRPDLVHFLHFNVPLLFSGTNVVTIHDLLMHRQVGLAATTLNPISYFLKRLAYKIVFANAVQKAAQIIVPSQAVKDEVAYYHKLNPEKITVTYEGV